MDRRRHRSRRDDADGPLRSTPSCLDGCGSAGGLGLPHLDWLLLAGMVTIVGGGLLIQIAWEKRHG